MKYKLLQENILLMHLEYKIHYSYKCLKISDQKQKFLILKKSIHENNLMNI